jgi:succinate dehydrogenase/fumarate reductase cytochrome b subunit
MEQSQQIRTVRIIQKTALIILFVFSLLIFIFALLSGSESFGGGVSGIIKNSPNSLPWLVLLALVIIAWRNPLFGGILITIAGAILTYYFNFSGDNFFLLTFIICMLIVFLGLLVWMTESYLRALRKA